MHRSIADLIRMPLLAAVFLAAVQARAHEQMAEVAITRADCARLVEHVPAPDVAYRPGVDAYGREVAPADLNGGAQIQVPETLHIPIEIDLQERFGIPANPALYQSDIPIGQVVYQNGRLSLNGRPLQDDAAAELTKACQKIIYGKPE